MENKKVSSAHPEKNVTLKSSENKKKEDLTSLGSDDSGTLNGFLLNCKHFKTFFSKNL